ncbi:MAG TPA: hypothetical protein VMT38_05195 [Terracidiphilus sp.]|nr:hypothetical protein [Terracidiphilus sp.]
MNTPQINSTTIVIAVVVIVALVVLALIVSAINRRRTQRLRAQFGPEYDRTLAVTGGRRATAEKRLVERTEHVHKLHIRALTPAERDRFVEEWGRVQAHFVDAPAGAVTEADQLIGDVMANCGYPVGDFEQRAADISVDHPVVTQNYRTAHEIAVRQAGGRATTEDLRRAMIHYRALFDELIAVPRATDPRPVSEAVVERSEIVEERRRAS